ncbi:hypothetical protein GCM10028819_38730 [Spirosoma humi]
MKAAFTCLICLCTLCSFAGEWTTPPDRKKTIVLLYDAYAQDQLAIHNKFGQVKVELWRRPEIQVTVRIRAHSDDPAVVDRYLNSVLIREQREHNQITIHTSIESQEGLTPSALSASRDSILSSCLQVDYTILMPAENKLTLTNQFGNTVIPSFKAPLTVFVQNGNFTANTLTHSETSIKAEYGSVAIKTMDDGEVDVSFGNLAVKSAKKVKLNNKMGKLQLGRADELTTMASYSEMEIGQIHQSALMTISFSNRFHMEHWPESLTNLDMALSYSSVVLPVDRKSNYNFNASLTNSGFSYPANKSIVLQTQSTVSSEANAIKRYSGIVGKGTGSKVQLVGSYSTIGFK